MRLGPADYYKHGDWNATCDVCGFKFKASELRRRWDNMRVCSEDFEERHPQDFLKGKPDRQNVPWTRPEGLVRYVTVNPLDPDDVTYSVTEPTYDGVWDDTVIWDDSQVWRD